MSKSNISVGTQGWADRINAAWRKAATAYIDIGNMLIEAKKTVLHGDWSDLLDKLDFDKRTAQRLMEIARDPRLSNPAHAPLLPKHWTPLYELTRLSDEDLAAALSSGATKREEVRRLRAPRPTVTDAEYQDVTEPPAAAGEPPEKAVSDGDPPPVAATPHDEREGGDSVSSPLPKSHHPPEITTFRINASDPVSMFSNGLLMAMRASQKRWSAEEAARLWPDAMPLLSDDVDLFADWIFDFAAIFRALHGNGNDAALADDAA